MRKDTLYYINTDNGCGIRAAQNIIAAKRQALREAGTYGFKTIRRATQDDIAWVSGMGGHVPLGVVAKHRKES
jgi:hypothetical protein